MLWDTKILLGTLELIEVGDEKNGFLLAVKMTMWWGETISLLVILSSYSTNSRVSGRGGLKWGNRISSITSTSTSGLCDNGLLTSTEVVTSGIEAKIYL